MKKRQKSLLLIILFSMKVIISYSQDTSLTSDTLIKIANNGIEQYLNIIKNTDIRHCGFNSIDELDHMELGNPVDVFMLSRTFYEDSLLKNDEYIMPAGKYMIPLIVNDTIRSFLTIGKLHDRWQVVGIGESNLAGKLMKCIQNNKLNRKIRLRLLIETVTQTFYVAYIEKNKEPVYMPLIPSKDDNVPDKKINQKEILSLIHQKYYKNSKLNN